MENSPNNNAEAVQYKFLLFVSGMSEKSAYAIANLRRICDQNLAGNFELQIIDVSVNKQQAVDYQIIAIPTLIKIGPLPPRIILGDLSDTSKVLHILDIAS